MKELLLEIVDYFIKHKKESFTGTDVAVLILKMIKEKKLEGAKA